MWRVFFVAAVFAVSQGSQTQNTPKPCPRVCPTIYQPVCGSCAVGGKRTFSNDCDLSAHNECNKSNPCSRVGSGECPPRPTPGGPQCPDACLAIYKPICAQCANGKRTFGNACSLQQHNCQPNNQKCTKISDGECPPEPPGCPMGCPKIYNPVCAQCPNAQRTFGNECELRKFNCVARPGCAFLREGNCTQPIPCPRTCPSTRNVICALCPRNMYRIFKNPCLMNIFNCHTRQNCRFISHGTSCRVGRARIPLVIPVDTPASLTAVIPDEPQYLQSPKVDLSGFLPQAPNAQNHVDKRQQANERVDEHHEPQVHEEPDEGEEEDMDESPEEVSDFPPTGEPSEPPSTERETEPPSTEGETEPPSTEGETEPPSTEGKTEPPSTEENEPQGQTNHVSTGRKTEKPDTSLCAATLCSNAYEPVCARCGKTTQTFTNVCMFNIHNCFNNNGCKQLFQGECPEPPPSPVLCTTEYSPVCANCTSGFRTFPNRCFLSADNVFNSTDNCMEISDGVCITECPLLNCLNVQEPLCAQCGFDQRTFDNDCTFRSYNCPNGFICKKIRDGRCPPPPSIACTKEWKPVCAVCSTGLETFSNRCFMDARNIENPKARCVLHSHGVCRPECAASEICTEHISPVCAQCGYHSLTFPNLCQFSRFNCRGGFQCRLVHRGYC